MRLIGRKKVEGIAARLSRTGIKAAVFVSSEPLADSNIEYLTGFGGMQGGALVLINGSLRLLTTELDYERALSEAAADDILRVDRGRGLYNALAEQLKGCEKIGVVKSRLTLAVIDGAKIKKSSVADIGKLMAEERAVKEPKEIEALRDCARITNRGIRFLQGFLKPGLRENEVAAELERRLKMLGSERTPFETIVTSGRRSALIHPSPSASEKRISWGLGLIDFGVVRKGYSSDVTVPFISGKPKKEEERMMSAVLSAWEALENKIAAGVQAGSLHRIYENCLKKAGFGIKHSLGHGIGLDVHDYPPLSGADVKLSEGMTLAIEPGAYKAGTGGFRLENDILVKKKGSELLTQSKLISL